MPVSVRWNYFFTNQCRLIFLPLSKNEKTWEAENFRILKKLALVKKIYICLKWLALPKLTPSPPGELSVNLKTLYFPLVSKMKTFLKIEREGQRNK